MSSFCNSIIESDCDASIKLESTDFCHVYPILSYAFAWTVASHIVNYVLKHFKLEVIENKAVLVILNLCVNSHTDLGSCTHTGNLNFIVLEGKYLHL